MKVAVIGGGVSGLVCACLLSPHHDVTLFEKEPRLGGHTHTVTVHHEGRAFDVDTGFIVFNERNYPLFCRLLDRLGVRSRTTTMSFSVHDEANGFEYGGTSIAGAIGPCSNLLRPRWWAVAAGVATLGTRGKSLLMEAHASDTIGDLYHSGRLSKGLLDDYLVPMAAAIWSAPRDALLRFPAKFMLRFFDNHGMLDLRDRPQWRTIEGGSHAYIKAMRPSLDRCTIEHAAVERVHRRPSVVDVSAGGTRRQFDRVILATHSDEAIAMLADPTIDELEVLRELPYQPNEVVLHTDASLLPRRRRCWAAWNYRLSADESAPIAVTYNMSILQGLDTRTPICVSLNAADRIAPECIIRRHTFHHPIYTLAGDAARARWQQISGVNCTHFCGAYWGNGFHEDGVASAVRVCEQLGVSL